MSKLSPDLKESIVQAQRWHTSQGSDQYWSSKTKNFWKVENLDPRYIPPKQLAGLFYLFKFDTEAWQRILDAGLSFDVLHPNGRSFSNELLTHPFSEFFKFIFLTKPNKGYSAFDLLLFLKERGLRLNAKFKNQPYYEQLKSYRWSEKDVNSIQYGLHELQRLGFRLDERNQKGNTMLHEAILKSNWAFCEALIGQDMSRLGWIGEKQRTAFDFFNRKLAQNKDPRFEIHIQVMAPNLMTYIERFRLQHEIPTNRGIILPSKPGKRL